MTVKTRGGWGWKLAEVEGEATAPPLPRLCETEGPRVATAGNPMTAKAAHFHFWRCRDGTGVRYGRGERMPDWTTNDAYQVSRLC